MKERKSVSIPSPKGGDKEMKGIGGQRKGYGEDTGVKRSGAGGEGGVGGVKKGRDYTKYPKG